MPLYPFSKGLNPVRRPQILHPLHRMPPRMLPLALVSGVLMMGGWAEPGFAQTATGASSVAAASPAEKRYAIPAGPVETVLTRFASESGILLASPPGLLQARQSPGLHGSYAPGAGLEALLAGTGLRAVREAEGQYRLHEASPRTTLLTPVTVTGRVDATTEGTGSYASSTVTLAKGDQSVRDIAQAVSVITRQRMDDQAIMDIRDALNSAPGVSMVANDPGGHFYSRGFFIQSYQFDGVPLERQLYARGSAFNSDTAIYDRIEIMRGPQGLLEGAGDPSGSVNLVRKRPTAERQVTLTGRVGSWDRYGVQLDAGGALDEAQRVRGRVVINANTQNSFRDYLGNTERTFYGAIDMDLTPATTVGLAFSRETPYGGIDWSGLPNADDGSMPDYDRATNLSAPWNRAEKTQDTWFLDLTHRFDSGWKFKASVARVTEDNFIKYLLRSGRLGPPSTYRGDAYGFDMSSRNVGVDAHLTGTTALFARPLHITAGANFSRQNSTDIWGWKRNVEDLSGRFDQRPTVGDIGMDEILAANRMDDGYRSRKRGFYANARYQITDPLSVILGGRLSWFEQTYRSDGAWGPSSTTARENRTFTPFAGALLRLDDQWTAYASYADIFRPQSQRNVEGEFLSPVTGRNYELGLKGSLLNGQMDVAFAVFRTAQKQVAFEDNTVSDDIAETVCRGTCYRPSARVRSQGFEAEVSGEPLRGLQLAASYSYTQTRHIGEDVPSVGYDISANTGVPRHLARVWAMYQLPGAWSRITVGGGLTVQSRAADFAYYGRSQGGYTVLDARLAYRFNDRVSAALNIGNLTDKRYFQSISYSHNFYGAPRNYLLSVQYRM